MNRVFVIEDQAEIRALIRRAFEFGPLAMHEADSGPEGLAAARRLRPDLMLLAVMMPGSADALPYACRCAPTPS